MPKSTEYASPWGNSGIKVTWTPTANRLDITGWYDHFVGIEGGSLTLGEFFQRLGITEKHCRRALREAGHDDA